MNCGAGCPFEFLFLQGLIGWVGARTVGGRALSIFLTGSELSSRDRTLPESSWYVLHPVIYPWLRERHGDERCSPSGYLSSNRAIVGGGLEMEYPAVLDSTVSATAAALTITGARSIRVPVACMSSMFLLCVINAISSRQSMEIGLNAFESSRTEIESLWKDCEINGASWTQISKTIRSTFARYHALTNRSNEWLRLAFSATVTAADEMLQSLQNQGTPELAAIGQKSPPARQKQVVPGPVAFERQSNPATVRLAGISPSDVRIVKKVS